MMRYALIKNIAYYGNFKLASYQSFIGRPFFRPIHSDHSKDYNTILAKLMTSSDANPRGILHGGVNLQFAEKSGLLICKNYLNQHKSKINNPVLCRMENTDFISPGIIGEVMVAESKIDFTSQHSMRVCTDISGLKILGKKTPISRSVLWYANCEEVSDGILKAVSIPPCENLSINAVAFEQYRINKEKRLFRMKEDENIKIPKDDFIFNPNSPQYSVSRNSICIHYTLSPDDCGPNGYMLGGTLLKLLDESSGLMSIRYFNNLCTTVRVEDVNFYSPVTSKDILKIYSFPVFNSSRSIEVQSIVVNKKSDKEQLVCSTINIFVSLNKDGSLNEVPPLLIESESERTLFDKRYKNYLQRKQTKS